MALRPEYSGGESSLSDGVMTGCGQTTYSSLLRRSVIRFLITGWGCWLSPSTSQPSKWWVALSTTRYMGHNCMASYIKECLDNIICLSKNFLLTTISILICRPGFGGRGQQRRMSHCKLLFFPHQYGNHHGLFI